MKLTPDNLWDTLYKMGKTAECIWWPENKFNLVRDFAKANGFHPPLDSFKYMGIRHFKLSK